MTDDAVREIHGVACRDNSAKLETVVIRESDSVIKFDKTIFGGTNLTPWQARYLAAKLYRLARRIKTRTDAMAAPVLDTPNV